MDKIVIANTLRSRGYTEQQANRLSTDLSIIGSTLKDHLSNWLVKGVETDFSSNNISISMLMKEYGLKYPAALLTMDWVLREPELAIAAIKKGVR